MKSNTGTIRAGIGGWVFPPWRGAFYPVGLRQAEELSYASRHVVGVAPQSFRSPALFDLLREFRIAVALVDDEKHPAFDQLTGDFVYLRLRRCVEQEPAGYPPAALDGWADRAKGWASEGRDVFLYFINGAKVRAPAAAQAFLQRLST